MISFSEFMENSQEQHILSQLPHLNLIQQVELDIALHKDAIHKNTFPGQNSVLARDSSWKQRLIDVFNGENDPAAIKQLMSVIQNDIRTHMRGSGELTGSEAWHKAWIEVYEGWLNILKDKLLNYQ